MGERTRRVGATEPAGTLGTPGVWILGGFRVRTEDGTVVPPAAFRTAKTRHLLRLLALHVDHVVPVDALVEILWPQVPAQRGRASLRTAASYLRRTFAGEHLVRVGDALVLREVAVDVEAFRRAAETAMRWYDHRDLAVGLHHAREAMTIYQGDLAEDEPYLPALQGPAAQLALQHHHLVVESAAAALQLGHLQEAVASAEQGLAADGASERACGTLMRALVQLGEPAAALRAYERCRRELADELGVEPSAALRTLHRDLLLGSAPSRVDVPVAAGA